MKFIRNEKPKICERVIHEMRMKQCYDCFVYRHIGTQCLSSAVMCVRCVEKGRVWKTCPLPKSRAKCAVCGVPHKVTIIKCSVRRSKIEKPRAETVHPGDMLQVGGTDLTRLLEILASAARVTKILLDTGELPQFRYIHNADTNHNGEAEGEDSW